MAELLLYEASVLNMSSRLILPNLRNGIHVVCDRYATLQWRIRGWAEFDAAACQRGQSACDR
jgi:thymidylate kinase